MKIIHQRHVYPGMILTNLLLKKRPKYRIDIVTQLVPSLLIAPLSFSIRPKKGAFWGFYRACKKLCNMYYNFPFCRMSPINLFFENPDFFSKGDGNLIQESDEDYNQNVIRKLRVFVTISLDSELFLLSNEY